MSFEFCVIVLQKDLLYLDLIRPLQNDIAWQPVLGDGQLVKISPLDPRSLMVSKNPSKNHAWAKQAKAYSCTPLHACKIHASLALPTHFMLHCLNSRY